MNESPKPERQVRCPQCSGPAIFGPSNPWRPFCSHRCKLIDLGEWATGGYRIPVEAPDPDTDPTDA
ncbi:MAG: DNA gyrase inhibitor YacG [Burkholderiales bacterium]